MKRISSALLLMLMFALPATSGIAVDKSVKHLDLPDITSLEEATQVFSKTTSELRDKHKLDASELHEIHVITYSLEKAVAYFAENAENKQHLIAQKMVDVVELVHINSENDRSTETNVYLEEYFKLAEEFLECLL